MSKRNLETSVKEAIKKLKPYLEADGGDMELVEITEDKVPSIFQYSRHFRNKSFKARVTMR